MFYFGFIIVFVDFELEMYFFEDCVGLIVVGFFDFLGLFVFEFVVVYDFDDWWFGVGRDFD